MTLTRRTSGTFYAGSTVSYRAHVYSGTTSVNDVRLSLGADQGSISARCTMSAGLCKLGNVDSSGENVDLTVTVSSKLTSGGTVTVSAYAFSGSVHRSRSSAFKVTKKPTPSKSPSPTASHSSGSGSGSGSGSSGSGSGSTTPSGNVNSGTGTNGSNQAPLTAGQNNATLPNIPQQNQTPGQGQTPSTAPLIENVGNSQSMQNAADGPNVLTFDKLASTQAAWLAALLVAIGLLLTQVRLGKANTRGAKAAAKGAHRKTRGGRLAR